jgi:hypothetical protein
MRFPKPWYRPSRGVWYVILANTRDRAFCDLLISTWESGCRPQESLRVEARHVDLANQRWVRFSASFAELSHTSNAR